MRHSMRRSATILALAGAVAAGTISTASASPNAPEIRYGMTGFKVYCVQVGISYHQRSDAWTSQDGQFGNHTLSQVKNFQGDLGLSVDGKVGKNTGSEVLWGIEHAKVEKNGPWTTPWGVSIDNCYQVVPSHF